GKSILYISTRRFAGMMRMLFSPSTTSMGSRMRSTGTSIPSSRTPAASIRCRNGSALPSMIGTSGPSMWTSRSVIPAAITAESRCSTVPTETSSFPTVVAWSRAVVDACRAAMRSPSRSSLTNVIPLAPTVVAVALGIVFIVLVFLHVPRVNGPEYWIWRWQRRTDVAKIAIFFILAASPALIAQILFRRHRALALGLLALATAALQLAGNAIQPELHGVDRMHRIANDQLITSYYTVAETIVHLERRGFTVDWLRQFDAILQRAPQHATTKPPGPIAFY